MHLGIASVCAAINRIAIQGVRHAVGASAFFGCDLYGHSSSKMGFLKRPLSAVDPPAERHYSAPAVYTRRRNNPILSRDVPPSSAFYINGLGFCFDPG